MNLFFQFMLVLVLIACGLRVGAQDPPIPEEFHPIRIDVPAELEKVRGNASSKIPFGFNLGQSVRFQQVFHASQFSKLPQGGAFLTWFQNIRGACGPGSGVLGMFTNCQIRMSTTARGPDQLSSIFAENVGPDETVLRTGRIFASNGGSCSSFGYGTGTLFLDIPFYYNPHTGRNLLLELRVSDPNYTDGGGQVRMETQSVTNDSVSRIAAFSSTATTADVVDTAGLIATFIFHAAPALNIWMETNNIIIAWPPHPKQFALQWGEGLKSSDRWQNYLQAIDNSSGFPTAIIPKSSLVKDRFFRLFWDSPQPGLVIPPRTMSSQ